LIIEHLLGFDKDRINKQKRLNSLGIMRKKAKIFYHITISEVPEGPIEEHFDKL